MLKEIHFTDSDLDGVGCKLVFKLAHIHEKEGVDFTIINLKHGSIDNEVLEYIHNGYMTNTVDVDTIISFSDLCPSRECLVEISRTNKIRIWDHHVSAMYALEIVPDATIVVENSCGTMQSGTSLLYQHFCNVGFSTTNEVGNFFVRMNRELSEFVGLLMDSIRAYDTFEFKRTGDMGPKYLNTLFFMLGYDSFYEKYLDRILHFTDGTLVSANDMMFVKARLDNEKGIIQKFIDDTVTDKSNGMIIPMDIRGTRVAFTFGARGANISELGYQWLKLHPEYDAIASISLGADKIQFTFRSVNDTNVADTLAIPMGGGGHAKAAGSVAGKQFTDKLIELIGNTLLNNE